MNLERESHRMPLGAHRTILSVLLRITPASQLGASKLALFGFGIGLRPCQASGFAILALFSKHKRCDTSYDDHSCYVWQCRGSCLSSSGKRHTTLVGVSNGCWHP